MSKSVFFTGATGYVGGSTLALLLEHPITKTFKYSVLVRSKEKATRLEPFGVRPVIATLDDASTLASEAEKADIVIHTADSADHLPSAQALLSGMKKGGKNPIYIHISGVAVLIDHAHGEHANQEPYSDYDSPRINALPASAPHRSVDLAVIGAASYARTHIVLPPMIYGIADNMLVKAGIANPLSIQIPMLIRAGIERLQGGTIGKGLNKWPVAHVRDVGRAIVNVLEGALAGKTATGSEGYYFVENGETRLLDLYTEIARQLSTHGIGTPNPTPFTEAEYQKYYLAQIALDSNARARAMRTRQLGWSPVHTADDDFSKNVSLNVEVILKNRGKGTV